MYTENSSPIYWNQRGHKLIEQIFEKSDTPIDCWGTLHCQSIEFMENELSKITICWF